MTTTLRILKTAPYITPIEQLLREYQEFANLSLPKDVYISRGGVQAKTPQLSAASYIPDSLEDRSLLKQFEQIEGRVVDFGTFRRRARGGMGIMPAAKTPLRKRNRSSYQSHNKSGIRLAYEHAPSTPAVPFSTYYVRVKVLSWSIQKALYTPLHH